MALKRYGYFLVLGSLCLSSWAQALLPSGAEVIQGEVNLSVQGNEMLIQQQTPSATLHWDQFSIGENHAVTFVQPSAQSVALNRVLGSEASHIYGSLKANGRVFLTNPNGIIFGPTARVDVGGLIASTFRVSEADILANRYHLAGNSRAAIENHGILRAAEGGSLALVAATVTNQGELLAEKGQVLMGAGEALTLDMGGLVKLEVTEGVVDALVENGGAIRSHGGEVWLTAKAAGNLVSDVINHTGITEATTLESGESGKIMILGGMEHDRIQVGGVLDASAPLGGHGGEIHTSASSVKIDEHIQVSTLSELGETGTWLIDPVDFTVSSGSASQTSSGIGADTLATSLNSSNVSIATTNGSGSDAGDITVAANVSKTGGSATILTLQAYNNININAAISSSSGRLHVVLQPNTNGGGTGSGTGSVNFSSAGQIVTNNGNFVAGLNNNGEVNGARGQDFTMADGSYIDVGSGMLGVQATGTITLASNSLRAKQQTANDPYLYYNNGSTGYMYSGYYNYIKLIGGSIVSTNTNASTPDMTTGVSTTLNAGTIGSSLNPIKIAGDSTIVVPGAFTSFPSVARTLYLTNTSGDSYVNHINTQMFSLVNVSLGTQASKTQQINLLGDPTGKGHITLNTDGSGVLTLASGDINTSGVWSGVSGVDPTLFPTSVTLSGTQMTFADSSVNTGGYVSYNLYQVNGYWGYSYSSAFNASGSSLKSSQVNGTADIKSLSIGLTASTIGSATEAPELGSGSSLSVSNSGGSTYLKSVDNSIGSISFSNVKTSGTHQMLFSGGDHINFSTDGNGIIFPSVGANRSDGSDFSQAGVNGVDLTGSDRTFSVTANSGYIEFDTDSIRLDSGTFTATINSSNTDRNSTKAIYAKNAKDTSAEITAGNINFNIYNSTLGLISDIELAQGNSTSNNSLTLYTYGGGIDLKELTSNYFKTLTLTLNGSSVAQNVAIDLNGADDVNFSDSGTLVTIDETKVALSANNRNWNLSVPSRTLQANGISLGTGSYTLSGGSALKLNTDILTNGGAISLTGSGNGIQLMRSLRIDSNSDDLSNSTSLGSAGTIFMNGTLSATGDNTTLVVDSGSTDNSGNTTQIYSNASNTGGYYLTSFSVTSKGSTNTNDGAIYFYGSSYHFKWPLFFTGQYLFIEFNH